MIRSLLWALRAAGQAFVDAWRASRGNPAIHYRFRVGQRFEGAIIIGRRWTSEAYDMDDGSTLKGNDLRGRPPYRMPGARA